MVASAARGTAEKAPLTMAPSPIINTCTNSIIYNANRSCFARSSPPPPPNLARVRSLQTNTSSGHKRLSLLASRLMPTPMHNPRFAQMPSQPFSSGLDGFLNGHRLLNLEIALRFLELFSSSQGVFLIDLPKSSIERTAFGFWSSM